MNRTIRMTSDESEDGDDHHSIEEDLDDESTSTQVMAGFVGRKVSIRNLLQKRKYGMISETKYCDQICSSNAIVQSLEKSHELRGHKGCVNSINFNHSGDLIVTGSDDTTVKIWNTWTGKCLSTLGGHVSNVFAVSFMNGNDHQVISGGNDSDVRLFDIEKQVCTVYQHHSKKVLKVSCNHSLPNCFLTCSADGTVRLFDTRCKYENCKIEKELKLNPNITDGYDHDMNIAPQYSGGGRRNTVIPREKTESSLLVDYIGETLYNVDINPCCSNEFIVSSELADTRMFDLRKIENHSPDSYANIYRAIDLPTKCPVSGSAFSTNGRQIVHTHLGDKIYTFDTYKNFEKDNNLDYNDPTVGETEPVPESYRRKFTGHFSEDTIKGVNFFGRNSEYVMTGSDTNEIMIWDSESGELVRVLDGHEDIVNTVISHPQYPIICSGGIEDQVVVWKPSNDHMQLPEEEIKKRKVRLDRVSNGRPESTSSAFRFMAAFEELLNAGHLDWQNVLLRHMGDIIGEDDDDDEDDQDYEDNDDNEEDED